VSVSPHLYEPDSISGLVYEMVRNQDLQFSQVASSRSAISSSGWWSVRSLSHRGQQRIRRLFWAFAHKTPMQIRRSSSSLLGAAVPRRNGLEN
jgi:hypothetical protein